MTSEETSSKRSLYIKVALYVVLMLVAGFFLVISFLVGIVGAILAGNITLFFGGVFFFILFFVVGVIAKRLEPAWEKFERLRGIEPKTTREAFRDSLPFFATIMLTLIFGYVFEAYIISFPTSINPDMAKEMLKAILTIDGILIGFYGVVLAQLLWAVHSKGNVIFEQMIAHRENSAILQELSDEVKRLARSKRWVIGYFFFSMMPLLASILLSLNRLPLIESMESVSSRILLFDPLLALIVGIVLLAVSMFQIDLLPRVTER